MTTFDLVCGTLAAASIIYTILESDKRSAEVSQEELIPIPVKEDRP